jgi:hypothetical protein
VTATPLNLGFLTVLQENGSYLGGYLVTNAWGRPLEFRLSSAVQPNKVQQILYASTLVPYVCGDLIGKALVERAGVPVALVVTSCEPALDLRLKLEAPVAALLPNDDVRGGDSLVVALGNERGKLLCHPRYPKDVEAVKKVLAELDGGLDLTEPFTRVREAVAEARKMGVAGRSAA